MIKGYRNALSVSVFGTLFLTAIVIVFVVLVMGAALTGKVSPYCDTPHCVTPTAEGK